MFDWRATKRSLLASQPRVRAKPRRNENVSFAATTRNAGSGHHAGGADLFGLKQLPDSKHRGGTAVQHITNSPAVNALIATFFAVFFQPASSAESGHSHQHHITAEQYAELREKVPLYREFSNEQIDDNMRRMGPNFHQYLSTEDVSGKLGVLALGHGFRDDGNKKFANAYAPIAERYPTAMALGMAMMTSEHIQTAVDELTAAGAEKIVVMPVTTLRDGGLTGQWNYIFDAEENAPWMSVPRVESAAQVVITETPSTDPEISAILLSNASGLSRDPSNEVVALVSHGPDNEPKNKLELEILGEHARYIRAQGGFADAQGFTLQDDAPSAIRAANIERIRSWVRAASEQGQTVIVLTTLLFEGGVHEKIQRDLAGLDYSLVREGVLDNPLFSQWIEAQIVEAE